MSQSNDNTVKVIIAWLRGQEWTGEKPTRGESADALQQLLDAHFRQTGFVDVDIAAALSSARENIAEMVESELECGQFTDAASIADYIRECARSTALEADRTELQAKIGHLEQALSASCDEARSEFWSCDRAMKAEQQRDALLSELQELVRVVERHRPDTRNISTEFARAAINKATD